MQDAGLAQVLATLCERVESLLAALSGTPRRRILVAVAGAPGSGKSTVCASVLHRLRSRGMTDIAILPMDGFHYRKSTLATFSDPGTAFRRRGAPFTFDALAFVDLVRSLRDTPVSLSGSSTQDILAPSFDHALQDPVEDDIRISARTKVVIIEGNYTLLDEEPWNRISKLFEDRWFVDVSPEVATERLVKRHMAAGIETSRTAAFQRIEENDAPNGELIRSKLIEPDYIIYN